MAMRENDISGILVDIFVKIHKILGPGLLESVYEEVICMELDKRKINYERQAEIRPVYEGILLTLRFR